MTSEDHLRYRRIKFRPNVPHELFTEEEVKQLQVYGSWLDALGRGKVHPETAAQERFVEVCKGDATAQSEFEKLWRKFVERKQWEMKNPESVGREGERFSNPGITGRDWGIYGRFR